jgi:hypothetical protein
MKIKRGKKEYKDLKWEESVPQRLLGLVSQGRTATSCHPWSQQTPGFLQIEQKTIFRNCVVKIGKSGVAFTRAVKRLNSSRNIVHKSVDLEDRLHLLVLTKSKKQFTTAMCAFKARCELENFQSELK